MMGSYSFSWVDERRAKYVLLIFVKIQLWLTLWGVKPMLWELIGIYDI